MINSQQQAEQETALGVGVLGQVRPGVEVATTPDRPSSYPLLVHTNLGDKIMVLAPPTSTVGQLRRKHCA